MPGRVRLIHPEAPHDEAVASLSLEAAYVWAYLPCYADREGRLEDKAFSLKLAIAPTRPIDMEAVLDELHRHRLIIRYQYESRAYIQIRSFLSYQRPHIREAASEIPSVDEGIERVSLGTPRQALDEPRSAQGKPRLPVSDPDPVGDRDLDRDTDTRVPRASESSRIVSPPPTGKERRKVEYSDAFERAWKLYGRKEEKSESFDRWKATAKAEGGEEELERKVSAALAWQAPRWAADNWQYAKVFHRYLKAKKYNDERPAQASLGLTAKEQRNVAVSQEWRPPVRGETHGR